MTTSKFGPRGELVADFLHEVREREVDWPRLVELSDTPEVGDAIEAVGYADWPGPFQNATQKAALEAFKALGLAPSDFAGPLDMAEVRGLIAMAAKAIAVGDEVAAVHATSVLRPFAEVGVDSAATALRSLSSDDA